MVGAGRVDAPVAGAAERRQIVEPSGEMIAGELGRQMDGQRADRPGLAAAPARVAVSADGGGPEPVPGDRAAPGVLRFWLRCRLSGRWQSGQRPTFGPSAPHFGQSRWIVMQRAPRCKADVQVAGERVGLVGSKTPKVLQVTFAPNRANDLHVLDEQAARTSFAQVPPRCVLATKRSTAAGEEPSARCRAGAPQVACS